MRRDEHDERRGERAELADASREPAPSSSPSSNAMPPRRERLAASSPAQCPFSNFATIALLRGVSAIKAAEGAAFVARVYGRAASNEGREMVSGARGDVSANGYSSRRAPADTAGLCACRSLSGCAHF
jgi:hypothetical protein